MDEERENLGRKAARGAVWIGATSYIGFAIAFATGIVLARRIEPAVFGSFAFASAIVGFLRMIAGIGYQDFLIRHERLDDRVLRTVFTIASLMGFSVILLWLAICPFLIAHTSAPVVWVTGILAVVNGVAIAGDVPYGLMQRQFAMKKVAMIQLVVGVGISAATLATVFLGGEMTALVVQGAGAALVTALLYFLGTPMPLRFGWDRGIVREMVRKGKSFYADGAIMTSVRELDKLFIGITLNESQLGFYNRAQRMSGLFSIIIPTAITRTVLPAFSAVRADEGKLKFTYDLLMSLHLIILAPLGIGLFFGVEPLVELLYGVKWLPVVPVFRILTLVLVVTPLVGIASLLHISLNHPERMAWSRILAFAAFVPSLWFGLRFYEIRGAAWALVIYELVSFVALLLVTMAVLGVATTLRPLVPHAICAMLCFPPLLWLTGTGGFESLGVVWQLIVVAAVTAVVYGAALFTIDRKRLWTNVGFVLEKLGWSRAAAT